MIRRDRADELAALRDIWPAIAREIPDAIDDARAAVEDDLVHFELDELEEKFRRGEAEHDRDWLHMSHERLDFEIRAEVADLVLYCAMIRARWPKPTAPMYVTHRDLGDEQPEGKEA